MPLIHFTLKDGATRTVEAKTGHTLMETAIRANVRGIDAECGGSCACATCHVYVDAAFFAQLPAPDDMEAEMLDEVAVDREANSRLSCQIVITEALDGLAVRVPQRQA